jgi:paraquat-inducible protein B
MSKKVSKTTVGVFMVGALVLIVGAVLVLGSGQFFKNNPRVVMYFQGSVKGLSVGSPINFRGVKVGKVTSIDMILNPKDLSITIAVYGELERGSIQATTGGPSANVFRRSRSDREFLKQLTDRGLRAQLDIQSIVTGQLMVSLDFYPDKPAKFVKADPKTLELPTIPTPLQELAARVEKIPIEEIFTKMNDTLSGIEKMINSGEIREMLTKLNSTAGGLDKIVNSPETTAMLKSVAQSVEDTRDLIHTVNGRVGPMADEAKTLLTSSQKLVERLEGQINPLVSSLTKTSEEVQATLKKAQGTLAVVESTTDNSPIVAYQLQKTLDELAATARSLRLLTDTLQRQPESVLFGKKNTKEK